MIRINLFKKERKRLSLPDLSKLKEVHPKEFLKERALIIVPAIGALVIGAELFYAYRLKGEIEELQKEVSRLTVERNNLKKKADVVQAKKKALQQEINRVKGRIRYLEMSKEVILVLKGYYKPFNRALGFLYTEAPSTVWYDKLSQSMSFQKIDVELSFGSYDINSIKHFFEIVKREFPRLLPGEIKKQENKSGIIYYASTIKISKDFEGGRE
ncbi:MAG TPA: hypothetical protein ENJ61_03575 [Aquifex aeolicus]|uniref:Fimbrial assembly protein n=1 Tax=Aquifex aeolicus TaxID=63363 RepID=A0A7C5L6V2_AQUAO|nr:hypothetical protein [Aquifex aeolicus]